jgi:benzoylformate decarboxylase
MTLWDMAMTVREFAKKRSVTFARLPIGWPGEAYEFDGPLAFLGNDGGGAVGTGPGHTVGAALALKDTDRLTIGILGDGDYLMGATALWTASHLVLFQRRNASGAGCPNAQPTGSEPLDWSAYR